MVKPTYLILGGVGFTGRNIVEHLIENDLAESIVVVDKARPDLSWLTGNHKNCFENKKVIYKQKNLLVPANITEIFNSYNIDYVINCVAESRNGMSQEVFDECIVKIGVMCAEQANKSSSVKRFIQLSSGEVYSCNKDLKKEDSKINPWTKSGKSFSVLEKKLQSIPNLNYVIIRTAFTYGIGDRYKITPRIIITAVYKIINETMNLLWSKGLIMNTVHVNDVARAAVFLCENGESGSIYNVVDKSNTTQGSLTSLICELFGVEYSFYGKLESNIISKLDINNVCEEINDKHLKPWFDACQDESIDATPLTPYIHKELLHKNHLCMNGSKLESLGFTYKHPYLTKDLIKQIIYDLYESKMYPKKCLPS